MPVRAMSVSEIRDVLAKWPVAQVRSSYLGQVRALLPVWQRAINVWADLVDLATDKRERHLVAASSAFDLMDGWRSGQLKYVRKHREAIDSAISFVRNEALRQAVAPLRMAPVIRNLAGSLRSCLYVATDGYSDEQILEVVAQEIFGLAAVRSLYPVDLSELVVFLPPGASIHAEGGDRENFLVMLTAGSDALELEAERTVLLAEAESLWRDFERPRHCAIPEAVWRERRDGISAQLHYANVRAFHQR